MKKDKRILLAITGIALLLGGCGANQPKQKANDHKEVKTENVKSDVQSSTSTSQVIGRASCRERVLRLV